MADESQKNAPKFLTKPCPFCKGIGFENGAICRCVSGKGSDRSPELDHILNTIFGAGFYENRE